MAFRLFPLSSDGLNLDSVLTTNDARILNEFGEGRLYGGNVARKP